MEMQIRLPWRNLMPVKKLRLLPSLKTVGLKLKARGLILVQLRNYYWFRINRREHWDPVWEVSATFRGKAVKPAIVMADGESANPGELVLFTTNGEGWKHIGGMEKID